ncbi:MAG: hypothetical protein WC915_02800 [archaeon]|jgi:hypothetical protein
MPTIVHPVKHSNLRIKLRQARCWTRIKLGATKFGRYKTASDNNYYKYSRGIFDNFKNIHLGVARGVEFVVSKKVSTGESGVAFTLNDQIEIKGRKTPLLELEKICVGFTKDSLIIESMQGVNGRKTNARDYRKKFGFSLTTLISVIEGQAKSHGFSKIKIRIPESLYSYWYPAARTPEEIPQIRERITKLYEKVAQTLGYERRGNFFVKSILNKANKN